MEILKELFKVIVLIVALVCFGAMFPDVVKALVVSAMILVFGGLLLLFVVGMFMEIFHTNDCVGCGICIKEESI